MKWRIAILLLTLALPVSTQSELPDCKVTIKHYVDNTVDIICGKFRVNVPR